MVAQLGDYINNTELIIQFNRVNYILINLLSKKKKERKVVV